MTTLSDRPNTALLVIDVQKGVVADAYQRDAVVANVSTLVDKARDEGVPIVWVQHSGEDLEKGSEPWEYVQELAPQQSEPLVHKTFGSSFEATDLEDVLTTGGIGRLVVAGAETDARSTPATLGPLPSLCGNWSGRGLTKSTAPMPVSPGRTRCLRDRSSR